MLTITGILLGADFRSCGVYILRYRYGGEQILVHSIREYMKVWSEEIMLNAGSFSPSGVLE